MSLAYLFAAFMLLSSTKSYADIGSTYELKKNRIELLKNFSSSRDSSLKIISELDEEIFSSYEETINRLQKENKVYKSNNHLHTILSFGFGIFFFLFSGTLVYFLFFSPDYLHTLITTFRELFQKILLPKNVQKPTLTENKLMYYGLILITIFVVVGMIRSL